MLRTLAAALALVTTGSRPPPKGAVVFNNFTIAPPQGFNEDSRTPDNKKAAFSSKRPPATVTIEMVNLNTAKNDDCRKELVEKLPDPENKVDGYHKLERVKGKLWVQEKVDYVGDTVKRVIIGCDDRTGMIIHWDQKPNDLEPLRKPYNRMIDSVEITPLYGKKK